MYIVEIYNLDDNTLIESTKLEYSKNAEDYISYLLNRYSEHNIMNKYILFKNNECITNIYTPFDVEMVTNPTLEYKIHSMALVQELFNLHTNNKNLIQTPTLNKINDFFSTNAEENAIVTKQLFDYKEPDLSNLKQQMMYVFESASKTINKNISFVKYGQNSLNDIKNICERHLSKDNISYDEKIDYMLAHIYASFLKILKYKGIMSENGEWNE